MHHSYQDTVASEDTRNELLASYSNTTKIKERNCVDLKYSKVNTKHKKNESFLEIVLKAVGIKNDEELPTTKEISTLVLLGIMLVLLIISATGFIVMWFTEYYNNSMLEKLILSENSETAKDWIDPNPKYDTLLKIHIFNYTNINEFLSGKEDKIRVQDVGPLTYKEHTKKVQVVFNKNHTVTFRDHRNYTFLPEKSVCGEHDLFILPNVPLLSASIKIEKLNPLKKAIASNVIRFMKQDVFKTLSAHEFLWGYRDKIVGLDIGTGSNYFGLLRNRNGTSVDSLQINTGEDYIGKYSIITQFNGMPLLDFWSDEECNRIDGSDASMFPPTLLENFEQLNVFLSVLCRKIPLNFEKKVKILGNIDAFRYRTPLNVFAHPDINPENQCYCHNTQTCLPSGVINATKCYDGAPIYPSFPHFFSGDPAIYKSFEGIAPSAELHQTYADIHPRFAFPISGASRIQINVPIHKSDIVRTKIEEGTILPLIWIEITTGDFTDDIIDKLYVSTFGLDAIQYALKYGTLLVSVTTFGLILAICFYLQRRKEELSLSKDIQGEIRPHTSMKTTETNEQAEPRNENFGD